MNDGAYDVWIELVTVLTAGTTVIVALAALADRAVRSAVWKRTIWQAAAAALAALLLVEATGAGRGIVQLFSPKEETSVGRHDSTDQIEPASVTTTENDRVLPPTDDEPIDWETAGTQRVPDDSEGRYPPAITTVDAEPPIIEEPVQEAEPPISSETAGVQRVPEESGRRCLPANDVQTVDAPVAETSVGDTLQATALWPALLWLLGFLAIAAAAVAARLLLIVFRFRQTAIADASLQRRVDRLARRLGMGRSVRLLESPGLRTPVAFGIFWPAIALPPRFFEDFDEHGQEAMLAHEMAHLAARDPAWLLVADLLCAALWWQPPAWWLRRRLQNAGEAAADEASLLVPDGPGSLAACLVEMGRRLTAPRRFGWLGMTGNGFRSSLGARVERLLNLGAGGWRTPRRIRTTLARTALPLVLVLLVVFCTAWARPRATLSEGETTMTTLGASWRQSLAGLAVLALVGTVSGDSAAEPAAADQPPGVSVSEDAAGGDWLLALAKGEEREREGDRDRERGEGERRKDGDREREGDRERGEGERRKEGDREERREGERRDREGGERREGDREGRDREHPEAHKHRLMQARREIQEKMHMLERKFVALKNKEGEDAQHLKRQFAELRQHLANIERQLRGGDRDRPEGDRPDRERLMQHRRELEEKARAIHRKLEELKEGEHGDLREKLQHQLREIHGEIRRISGEFEAHGPHRPDQPRPHGDLERRLHHVRVAVDNLRAAGMNDAAEALARQAERIEHELRERGDRPDRDRDPEHRPDRDREHRPDRDPEHRPDRPRGEELERTMHHMRELHERMERMQREMQELREHLQRLTEGERDRERD